MNLKVRRSTPCFVLIIMTTKLLPDHNATACFVPLHCARLHYLSDCLLRSVIVCFDQIRSPADGKENISVKSSLFDEASAVRSV